MNLPRMKIYAIINSTGEIGVPTSIEHGAIFVLIHTSRGWGEVCLSAEDVTLHD